MAHLPNDMLAEAERVGDRSSYKSLNEEEKDDNRPSCGCGAGFICFIAYLFGWISGLIIGLVEKKSYYCVFHACQSIVISSIYCILAIVFALIDRLVIQPGGLGVSVISLVWFILYLILMIVCIIFAWKNEHTGDLFQIVGLGVLAEKMADKFFSIGNRQDAVTEY